MVQFQQLESKCFQMPFVSFSLTTCSSEYQRFHHSKQQLRVWMCHGRGLNKKINDIHERVLRIVHQDKKSSFETLLKRGKSTSIHIKNLQRLATELFKVKNNLSPEIMKKNFVFQENETYNLRSGNHLARKNIQTTKYGIESFSNLGAKLRNLLPREIKNSSSLTVFKHEIRKWTPEKCPCKLCQTYT